MNPTNPADALKISGTGAIACCSVSVWHGVWALSSSVQFLEWVQTGGSSSKTQASNKSTGNLEIPPSPTR